MHAANPGATAFDIGALTIEFGIMLALAYVLTRNIWLAVGIDTNWSPLAQSLKNRCGLRRYRDGHIILLVES